MDLFILSIALLIVLVLAVYAMTRGPAIEAEIQRLVEQVPAEQIYDDYRSNRFTLNLYVTGGIMLTGAYALVFFGAGGLDPRQWTLVNWIFAVIGLTTTVAITLGQRNLYSSVKQNLAALMVTFLILTFVMFSEVATSSEREDALVRDRSLQSPTLSAVQKRLSAPDTVPHSNAAYYQAEAARYQSLAEQCTGNCKRANQAKADSLRAKAQYETQRIQQVLDHQAHSKQQLIASSRDLEYQEQNHTAVVRWLKEVSGDTWMAAMMFASLVFVIAFESGFHFTGTKNGIYIEALSRLGYSVKRHRKRPLLLKAETPETRNLKPYTDNHTDKNTDHTDDPRQAEKVRVTDDLAALYETAKDAKTGEEIQCPECQTVFKKRTYNQCFCNRVCKDNYWNRTKPERLIAARGGAAA